MVLIYLDAGHGGKDSGASANGIREKDIVLNICKKIRAKLSEYENVKVMMSRDSDVYLTLEERTKKANGTNADVLLSIHCNAHTNNTARGFESYRYTSTPPSTTAFQNVMHDEIIRAIGGTVPDRGKKTGNFHMVRESKMKACLTENLFVSNSLDANLLKDEGFLDKIAEGHVNGLRKFLGLRRIERPPQEPTTGMLYKVQVGAFLEEKNAVALAEELMKLGYKPFIKYE